MRRRSFLLSCRDAMFGIGHVVRTQRNAKIQLAAAAVVIVAAAILRLAATDWALLMFAIALVLAAEVGNTAVEILVDAISPGPSEPARLVKDAAAGAVLLSSIGAAAVGIFILGPPLWKLVS